MLSYLTKLSSKNKKSRLIGAACFETILKKTTFENSPMYKISNWAFVLKNTIYISNDNINNDHIISNFIDKLLLISKNEKVAIYFQNLSNFYGFLLFDAVIKKNIKFNVIIKNNKIYKISIKNIDFLDFSNFISRKFSDIKNFFLTTDYLRSDLKSIFYFERALSNFEKHGNCILNIKILYISLTVFENEIKEFTSLSITNHTTITSLAFNFFRKKYLKNNLIYNAAKMSLYAYNIIVNSYRGGITDVYKPKGENLYCYDINSSYPYAMLNYMPVGKPQKLDDEALKNFDLNFFFWIFNSYFRCFLWLYSIYWYKIKKLNYLSLW